MRGPTHEEAFTGAFARALADRRDRPVRWSVHGRHGATIRRVRHRMVSDLDARSDVTVLLIGVNDVLNRTPTQQWNDDIAAVLNALTERSEIVVVAGIPPFEAFPSLPRALRGYLTGRGRVLDDTARALCASRPAASWISSTDLVPAEVEFFTRDGFHPSEQLPFPKAPDRCSSSARVLRSAPVRHIGNEEGISCSTSAPLQRR